MAKNQSVKTGKKLRGAVLIMVLTVMFMLIILLLATLTVVSTAQNRYYAKYEENQAYYTARSALDLFTDSIISDPNYIATDGTSNRKFSYTDETGATKNVDMSQGLALELELYKIKAKNNYNGTDYSSAVWGNIPSNTTLFGSDANAKTNYALDVSPVESITYTVEFPDMAGKNQAGRTAKYGRFVDEDSTGKQIATIKVEVIERIYNMGGDVVYTMDDLYKTGQAGGPTVAEVETAISKGNRTKDYMRLKITSTVEFMGEIGTAVVYYETTEPEVILTGNAMTSFGGVGNNNMTILGGISTKEDNNSVNNSYYYGGYYVEGKNNPGNTSSVIYLARDEVAFIEGDSYYNTNIPVETYIKGTISDEKLRPVLYIGGKVEFGTGSAGPTFGSDEMDLIIHGIKVPGGTFSINQEGNLYIVGTPVDMSGSYTGPDATFMSTAANFENTSNVTSLNVDGDVYIRGSVDLTKINLKNVTGTVYVDGDVVLNTINIDQNGKIDANQTGTDLDGITLRLTGEIYGPDKTLVGAYSKTVQSQDKDALGNWLWADVDESTKCAVSTDYNWSDIEISGVDHEASEDKIILPKGTSTKITKGREEIIPTSMGEYEKYYKRSAAAPNYDYIKVYKTDAAGNLIQEYNDDGTPKTEIVGGVTKNVYEVDYRRMTAEEYAGSTSQQRQTGDFSTAKDFHTTAAASKKIERSGNGYIKVDGGADAVELNATTEVDYYLVPNGTAEYGNPQVFGGNVGSSESYKNADGYDYGIYFHGGGTINLYLTPGTYGGRFTIADDTTVNFYFEEGDYQFGLNVMNESLRIKYHKNQEVIFGAHANAEKPPKINYYIDSKVVDMNLTPSEKGNVKDQTMQKLVVTPSVIKFYQSTAMLGYIYAPYAKFDINSVSLGGNAKFKWKYYYNKDDFSSHGVEKGTDQFFVLGSLVAGEVDMGLNNNVIAYISADQSSYTPGKPMFNWQAQYYNRK